MNPFLQAAKELVYPNGIQVTYTSNATGTYDVETGSVTNTSTATPLKAFPKAVKTSAYNYPNLIGKNVSEWLVVASDLIVSPSPLDKITRGSEVSAVDSYTEHMAGGEVILYKIITVRG